MDHDGIRADALNDDEEILKNHSNNPEYYYSNDYIIEMDALGIREKLNTQSPLLQKYWLGRLAYELAVRNEKVIAIKERIEARNLSKTIDRYGMHEYSDYDRAMILELEPYGFSPKVADNRLSTEHTTYPAKLYKAGLGTININTKSQLYQMIDIIDGAPKKKYGIKNSAYNNSKKIGKFYTDNYLVLIKLY